MKVLTTNDGLKKGDIIKEVEDAIIFNSVTVGPDGAITIEDKGPEHYKCINAFKITRVNSKTYSCEYIDGPYKNMGFKWHKGHKMPASEKKAYFLIEA